MKKVITYGTFDLLHYGHLRLLERAKALGDYLIVGVTADSFDKARGKINVKQSLIERIEALQATGIADEIIVEEYEGQKIDDIIKYDIDIFAIGSDWEGKFDYLKEYCQVVYLERTKGISSSDIRAHDQVLKMGFAGESPILYKYVREARLVNGMEIVGVFSEDEEIVEQGRSEDLEIFPSYEDLLLKCDAVYIVSVPCRHSQLIEQAIRSGVHILCESPIALEEAECQRLLNLAEENGVVLMDAIKTAYSTAYNRLLLLIKSGKIGDIVSIDTVCTSIQEIDQTDKKKYENTWNSLSSWGPTAMLPIFQILGTGYVDKAIRSRFLDPSSKFDSFTKVSFTYPHAVASFKVGKGVKSEGEMIISGTEGYVFVQAPWWKTDYFEIRFEDSEKNQRYFYQLEGEGIRYELMDFKTMIQTRKKKTYIADSVSLQICRVIEDFCNGKDVVAI